MRILALDVGTSRTKLAVYDEQMRRERLVSRATRAVGVDGGVDLGLLVADVAALFREEARDPNVAALGVTTIFGHVFLDAAGAPIGDGWAWNRSVARAEAAEIDQFCRQRRLDVGRPVTAELLAPRLLWLRRHETHSFGRIDRVIGIKDYLLLKLTGITITDPSQHDYAVLDPEVAAAFLGTGGSGYLPAAVPAHHPIGVVTPAGAGVFGVPAGTPVSVGSSDGTAAMYGAGVLAPGVVAAVSGSTDVCMTLERDPGPRQPGQADARADSADEHLLVRNTGMLSGTRLRGGSTGASGEALRWWRATVGDAAIAAAEWRSVPPGAEGVRVAPGFAGERAPFFRGDAGTIGGLTVRHGMAHIVRAFHEANAYRLARLTQLVVGSSTCASRMILGGGTASAGDNAAADAIRAAVLPVPLFRADDEHLSMRGAAMFALVAREAAAADEKRDDVLEELSATVAERATFVVSDPGHSDVYRQLYLQWLDWMEATLPPPVVTVASTLGGGKGAPT